MTAQTAMFDERFLEKLRHRGDPLADDVIKEFFDHELDEPSRGLMQAMIDHAPGSDEASVALGRFVDEHPPFPKWAKPHLLERGQELFAQYVPQFGLGLWMASIPAGYAGARDVVVLERTHELISHPKRRFIETGQFVLDVMTPGGLEPGGAGAADIRHVRLMHAAVRHMLTHDAAMLGIPPWDVNSGVPINQKAMLATMFTFSVVGLQSLEKFGVNIPDSDREAYVHTWSIIGHLMGIDDDLLPLDYASSAAIWESIKEREYDESDAGKVLTAHAIEVMQELIPGVIADGFPAAGIRFLLGSDTADMLGVPGHNWTSVLFVPGRVFGSLMGRFERDSRFGRKMTEYIGREVFKAFIELEREGRPSFKVPELIRRRLDLD